MTKEDLKPMIDKFMVQNAIDKNQRVEIPDGGIYLKNLLQQFGNQVRNQTIADIRKELKNLIQIP